MNWSSEPQVWRQRCAYVRLLLLYGLGCFLVVATALLSQTEQEQGWTRSPFLQLRETATPPPFLGITIDLAQASPTARRQALQRLRQTGFGWVRQRLDWGVLEPMPGHYAWQHSDGLLQDIVAAGLVPVVVLDGSPAWARAPVDVAPVANPLAPPADPATFARFVAAFAGRYQASLRYYQLWDEPNIAPHWGNRMIEPVAYAQLLKAVVPALRVADPDAVVITAALAPTSDRGHLAIDEVYFLQRLYAAGAAPYFDIVAAQPFGFGHPPDDQRAQPALLNFQRIKLLRQTLVAAGDGEKPMWAVRYGWNTAVPSPWQTVSAADQSAFATKALTIAQAQWPWLTAMAWAIDQPAAPPTDPSWGFALTPPLATAFHTWQAVPQREQMASPPLPFSGWSWGGLALAWVLVIWRAGAALRILPWAWWRHTYQSWPDWGKGMLWLTLVVFYYFVTWSPLIVFGWLLVVLLVLPNPVVGLSFVALLLPFYFQHKEVAYLTGLLQIPPAQAALGCLWVAICYPLLLHIKSLGKEQYAVWRQSCHPLDWLVIIWILINVWTAVNVWYWPAYWHGFFELGVWPGLLYLATRLLATTPARQQQISSALVAGGSLAALIGLGMWWRGEGTAADGVLRLVGPYFSPNHMALYLERSWWLGLGLTLSWQGRRRISGGLALAVIGLALWLTASRGAWLLGMPAGAVAFSWTAGWLQTGQQQRWLRLPKRTMLLGLGAAMMVIILVGVGLGDTLWLRLTNSASIAERLVIWQATFQMWRDHWWLGVGPGGFFWRYPAYLDWAAHADPNLLHPHNLWLEVLAGWGAVGFGWLWVVGWQVGRLATTLQQRQQPLWPACGLVAALAAGVAHAQVDAFGVLPDLVLWHWLALGLLVAQQQTQRQAKPTAGSIHQPIFLH